VTVRVYVPATLEALARYVEDGGIGPSPVHAHAVTEWLRESWPDADEEEWAYAALMAAADDSAALLADSPRDSGTGDERPRRVVVVAEVPGVTEDRESTVVSVDSAVAMRLVRAVHADTDDVDPAAPEALGDLGWYAVQEIPALLA
jgi:hypothetical protein